MKHGCFGNEGSTLTHTNAIIPERNKAAGMGTLSLSLYLSLRIARAHYQILDFPAFRAKSKMPPAILRLLSNPQLYRTLSHDSSPTHPPLC